MLALTRGAACSRPRPTTSVGEGSVKGTGRNWKGYGNVSVASKSPTCRLDLGFTCTTTPCRARAYTYKTTAQHKDSTGQHRTGSKSKLHIVGQPPYVCEAFESPKLKGEDEYWHPAQRRRIGWLVSPVRGWQDRLHTPFVMHLGGMWPPASRCGAVETTNNLQLRRCA